MPAYIALPPNSKAANVISRATSPIDLRTITHRIDQTAAFGRRQRTNPARPDAHGDYISALMAGLMALRTVLFMRYVKNGIGNSARFLYLSKNFHQNSSKYGNKEKYGFKSIMHRFPIDKKSSFHWTQAGIRFERKP